MVRNVKVKDLVSIIGVGYHELILTDNDDKMDRHVKVYSLKALKPFFDKYVVALEPCAIRSLEIVYSNYKYF